MPTLRDARPRHLPTLERRVDLIDPALRRTFRELLAGEAPWPLCLFGPAGTGKTRAALCLCDYVGGPTRFYSVAELCGLLIDIAHGTAFWPGATGGRIFAPDFWKDWGRAALCVLDEIGARERVSDHHYEAVKLAIDARENRPAVFVSNLDLTALATVYDDRVASRLASGTVVQLAGRDRRLG